DPLVTGVQTCALPIFPRIAVCLHALAGALGGRRAATCPGGQQPRRNRAPVGAAALCRAAGTGRDTLVPARHGRGWAGGDGRGAEDRKSVGEGRGGWGG